MPLPRWGAREGLDDRLQYWIDRFSTDKSFPWVGSGIIADLKTAIQVVRGEPDKPAEYDL